MESTRPDVGFDSSVYSKPDRIFDMTSPAAFPRSPSAGIANPLIYGIVGGIIRSYLQTRAMLHGRYFYYTGQTARIARTGIAGSEAYRYSLDDPRAGPRKFTREEIASLSLPIRLLVRSKNIVFFAGALITVLIAVYIAHEYLAYGNLLPCLLIIPTALGIVLWLSLVNMAEGSTVGMLPRGIRAFGANPELPQ